MTEVNAAHTGAGETPTWSVAADNVSSSLIFHMNGMAITHENCADNVFNGYSVTEGNVKQKDEDLENEKRENKERWIWVLDPMTRKLRVPFSQLVPTQATATTGTVPSLCISFLEGRCRHQWCRQAHVLPSAIPQLRYEALHAPTCCRVHDDPHDTSVLVDRFRFIRIVNNTGNNNNNNSNNSNSNSNSNSNNNTNANVHNSSVSSVSGMDNSDRQFGELNDLIPTERVAQTVGLLRFMAHSAPPPKRKAPRHCEKDRSRAPHGAAAAEPNGNGNGNGTSADAEDTREEVLELPAKLICRLHLAHRCRYLEDCNNIHICREYELRLQPPPHVVASLASVGPATRTVTIADTCYATNPLAVGEVTDEQFRLLCEQQQKLSANVPATTAGGGGGGGTGTNSGSPMVYGNSSLSSYPPSGTSPFTLGAAMCRGESPSALLFPAHPESDATSPVVSPALGNLGAQSITGAGPLLQQQQQQHQQQTRVLRIYDVRPKAGAASATPATSAAVGSAGTCGTGGEGASVPGLQSRRVNGGAEGGGHARRVRESPAMAHSGGGGGGGKGHRHYHGHAKHNTSMSTPILTGVPQ